MPPITSSGPGQHGSASSMDSPQTVISHTTSEPTGSKTLSTHGPPDGQRLESSRNNSKESTHLEVDAGKSGELLPPPPSKEQTAGRSKPELQFAEPEPEGDQTSEAGEQSEQVTPKAGRGVKLPPELSVPGKKDPDRPSARLSFRPSGLQSPSAKRTTIIRQTIKKSRWYHTGLASTLRVYVHHRRFAAMMFTCLLVALFLPELWVLCGIDSNIILDVVLTITMAIFIFEILVLSALDATYFLSFFFFMDILGTFSMIFHISYMLGVDNTQEEKLATTSGTDAEQTLMLLRAARAARIGARIGRVSRAVRLLRFLPFLANVSDPNSEAITVQVSGQLANLLAIRVAALTVILVMLIPLLDIFAFPQSDLALEAWAERLSTDWEEGHEVIFYRELNEMVNFFDRHDYGPYMACHGRRINDDKFECIQEVTHGWHPSFDEPPRGASALQVHTNTFMVGYNMHTTFLLEHGLAIVNIFFTIGIMTFSGLALSSVVNELAVRPLERMLQTVRTIARTVFKFSANVIEEQDAENDGEEYNVETSNEMKLLEAVVGKLAIIANLSTVHSPEVDADMGDEEIGVLNMMQGTDVVKDTKAQAERRASGMSHEMSTKSGIGLFIHSQVPRMGVTMEVFNSYSYNTLSLNAAQMSAACIYTFGSFHEHSEGFLTNMDEMAVLQRFIQAVESEYLPNPFHNFSHATDVLHGVARMMRMTQSDKYLTALEQYALLVAAVGHDLAHPGVNNGFLAEVGHELALQYNDLSPLENMHVSKLYSLLVSEDLNILKMLSRDQYKDVRRYCIETILHTDMMGHQAMVKDLQMLYQMNEEVFKGHQTPSQEYEILSKSENKLLVMENILHSADVSNPCRTWLVSHAWANMVLEEFFAQGDQEKMLGVPVQFLNDRDKLDRPNSQIGFLEFMIAPFFAAQIRLFPMLHDYGDNLQTNIQKWEEMWVAQSSPAEDAKAKVRARVERVQANLKEAKDTNLGS